ncbi:MAG: glycosyltransferase family 4 protein [Prevotella sp.]|nr:glycosyltransferase family 4 protein [Prevotella sp.]MBO5156237.1 glycosyltransferase family 4 protein [Prevotella sp.]MBO5204610.1 glycosyltransferase family 4 protein [Prevotella sp.]
MKIAYIYTALTSFGGVDRILTIKANYFAEHMGYDVYIITDSQAGRPPVFPLSPKVHHIDLETDFDEQYHYGIIKRFLCYRRLMKRYRQRLEKTLYEIKPDIVSTTCGRDLDFLTEIKDGSKKIGESHIAKQYCRNFHLMEARGGIYKIVARYWRWKQEKAIKKLDALVVLTNHDAESWKSVKQATVIPNPISITNTQTSTCRNKRVISVGRLSEQKGFDMLIDTWKIVGKKHPDWELNIYGEGELKDSLERKIKDKNISYSLHLCGPAKNITEKYAESSIYVMSSRFEGFGLVLVEAMACGLPCVSFDCPHGPAEIIRNGENGILVENGNIDALAKAIDDLIINEEKRIAMGKKSHELVQKYSQGNIMKMWIELFNKLKDE